MVEHSRQLGVKRIEFRAYKYGTIKDYEAQLSIEQAYKSHDYGQIVSVRDLLSHIAAYVLLAACAASLTWFFAPDWLQDRVMGLFIASSILISVFMVADFFIGAAIFRHRVVITGVLDKVIFGALGLYVFAIIYYRVIAVAS